MKTNLIYVLSIILLNIAISNSVMAQAITVTATSSNGSPTFSGNSAGTCTQVATGTKNMCSGDSIQFGVTYAAAIDHVVWTSNTGGTFTPNNQNFNPVVHPVSTTDYFVYVFDSPTNCVGFIKVSVFIQALPLAQTVTANGVAIKTGRYCQGTAGTIFGLQNSQIGCTYQLQLDGTSTNVGASVSGTGTAITAPSAVASGSYQFNVTDLIGCVRIIR